MFITEKVKGYLRNGKFVKGHSRKTEKKKRPKKESRKTAIAKGAASGATKGALESVIRMGLIPVAVGVGGIALQKRLMKRKTTQEFVKRFIDMDKSTLSKAREEVGSRIYYLHDLAKKRAEDIYKDIKPNTEVSGLAVRDKTVKPRVVDGLIPEDRNKLQQLWNKGVKNLEDLEKKLNKSRKKRAGVAADKEIEDTIKAWSADKPINKVKNIPIGIKNPFTGEKIKMSPKEIADSLSYKKSAKKILKDSIKSPWVQAGAALTVAGSAVTGAAKADIEYAKKYDRKRFYAMKLKHRAVIEAEVAKQPNKAKRAKIREEGLKAHKKAFG